MMTPQPMRSRHRHHRGTVYVMVLVTAMLTTLIGLSGLLVMRVERRTAELTGDAAAARHLAISAVDVGLYETLNNPNWRTNHTHDVWAAPRMVDTATITYKFLDETDSNLADSANDPVVVIGKAQLGQSVMMFSVTLTPGQIVPGSWRQVVD